MCHVIVEVIQRKYWLVGSCSNCNQHVHHFMCVFLCQKVWHPIVEVCDSGNIGWLVVVVIVSDNEYDFVV